MKWILEGSRVIYSRRLGTLPPAVYSLTPLPHIMNVVLTQRGLESTPGMRRRQGDDDFPEQLEFGERG